MALKISQPRARDSIEAKVRISPRLEWVVPYLKKAKARMPSLILPTQIRSFKPTRKKEMRVWGNVYFETKIIVLATHTQKIYKTPGGKRVKRIVAIPKSEILDTLAHELAHIKYPDHDYEHEEYTKIIFKTFGLTQKCPTCRGAGSVPVISEP